MKKRPTVKELEAFFEGLDVNYSVVLPTGEEITNIGKFAKSHLSYVRNNKGNKAYLPYYERLETVMKICS